MTVASLSICDDMRGPARLGECRHLRPAQRACQHRYQVQPLGGIPGNRAGRQSRAGPSAGHVKALAVTCPMFLQVKSVHGAAVRRSPMLPRRHRGYRPAVQARPATRTLRLHCPGITSAARAAGAVWSGCEVSRRSSVVRGWVRCGVPPADARSRLGPCQRLGPDPRHDHRPRSGPDDGRSGRPVA